MPLMNVEPSGTGSYRGSVSATRTRRYYSRSMNTRSPGRKPLLGFTLDEVLVVVVTLRILAAIVVPQFLSASDNSLLGR